MNSRIAFVFVLVLFSSCIDSQNCNDSPSQPSISKDASNPKTEEADGGNQPKPKFKEYRFVHPEPFCEEKQKVAYLSGCIDLMGLSAMQVLHGAPICTAENHFSHWEACDHQALREVKRILDSTPKCERYEKTDNACEIVTLTFKPKVGKNSSKGKRILILEESNLEHLALTRYASRVLEIIEADNEGIYKSIQPKFSLPRSMKEILVDTLDQKVPWISPRSLSSIGGVYYQKFSESPGQLRLAHGNSILNLLAEMNPKAEFVIASSSAISNLNICDAGSKEWRDRYRKYQRNIAGTLIEFIKKHQINFINMSFGQSIDEYEKALSHCGNKKNQPSESELVEIMNIALEEYYLPLASLEEVILVQAGARSKKGQESFAMKKRDMVSNETKSTLIDCVLLPNRLRVGGFSVVSRNIGLEGVDFVPELDEKQLNASLQCLDILLNNGFHDPMDDKWGIEVSPFNLTFTMWLSSSSIVSSPQSMGCNSEMVPLAISYLLHLKDKQNKLSQKELLELAKSGGKYKDPLKHELHLFNVFGSEDFQEVITNHRSQETAQ